MESTISPARHRIVWIDIAKAITIIVMIIGHIYPYGSNMRNLIFSFHMPLFFILSGYTIRSISTVSDLRRAVWKDFKGLLIPCVGIRFIDIILYSVLGTGGGIYII